MKLFYYHCCICISGLTPINDLMTWPFLPTPLLTSRHRTGNISPWFHQLERALKEQNTESGPAGLSLECQHRDNEDQKCC